MLSNVYNIKIKFINVQFMNFFFLILNRYAISQFILALRTHLYIYITYKIKNKIKKLKPWNHIEFKIEFENLHVLQE